MTRAELKSRPRCCICDRPLGACSAYLSAIFGKAHHACMNRAEDFVRAMARMNQCSADLYLQQRGSPSAQTLESPVAKYARGAA